MNISPFQALTLLAKKYQDTASNADYALKFAQIEKLFLLGVRTDEDREILVELLKDEALTGYRVSLGDKEAINNDPVRRYYESILAHETLKETIDDLDKTALNHHYRSIYGQLPMETRLSLPPLVYHGSIADAMKQSNPVTVEYIAAIKKLRQPENFLSLQSEGSEQTLADRLDKFMLIVKITHAAVTALQLENDKYPLNLYAAKDSPYSGQRRGKKDRKDEAGLAQQVRSMNLGLMRSYHALSQDDPLAEDPHSESSGLYKRPADFATYLPGSDIPELYFSDEVSPFSNSISGTMLCQLRVIAKLCKENEFVFADDPNQLKIFIKCLVSYMIFNAGGHSFREFMGPFELPQVKEMFKDLLGFETLNTKTLFQDENKKAFRSAMNLVIQYNDKILAKRKLHEELVSPEVKGDLKEGEDELTARARSRLK